MNKEIFDFLKIKPLLAELGLSNASFTQKLHNYKVRGIEQGFSGEQLRIIKNSLTVITDIVTEEIKKIDPENPKELERKRADGKKLCGRMKEHEQ